MSLLSELEAKRNRLNAEMAELRSRWEAEPSDSGLMTRLEDTKSALTKTERAITDERTAESTAALEARMAEGHVHYEDTDPPPATVRTTADNSPAGRVRSDALRAIERRSDVLDARSGDRLSALIEGDRLGLDAEYIAAISDPLYEQAFARMIGSPQGAAQMLSGREHEAMVRVGRAMSARALAVGAGETGGYAIPISLDPTILLQNDGAVNPIRDLATVSTITTTTWKGVASEGVEFTFQAEAAEAEDAELEISQPSITPTMARCWIPYSFETEDWAGLRTEVARLLADAKMVKEAEVFATGKGEENIPQGLVKGCTSLKETAGSKTYAIADVYTMQEALGARYQPKAVWLMNNTVINDTAKFVATADEENAPIMNDARTEILRKKLYEVSPMSAKTTTEGEIIALYGDVAAAYRIVDRVGMAIEVIPNVLKGGKPTGQRGLFAWFRLGAKVINTGAVYGLKVKA